MVKKLLLAGLLFATSAHAEWINTGGSDNYNNYMDPTTIKKVNNVVVSAWTLQDYKRMQPSGEMSSAILFHFNCSTSQTKLIAYTNYSGQMMQGMTLGGDSKIRDWVHVVPGSVGETMLTIACGMKL